MRNNFAKTILYHQDRDCDITKDLKLSKKMKLFIKRASKTCYYDQQNPLWKGIVTVLTTLSGGLLGAPPWYIKSQLKEADKKAVNDKIFAMSSADLQEIGMTADGTRKTYSIMGRMGFLTREKQLTQEGKRLLTANT